MTKIVPERQSSKLKKECATSPFRFLQAVAAPLLVLDENASIVWQNTACEQLFGFSLSELEGAPLWDRLILPECAQRARRNYLSVPVQHCTLDMLKKNGERILVRWQNQWIPAEDGGSGHIVLTAPDHCPHKNFTRLDDARNITGRRQVESDLQESEIRFKTLFDSAAEFIFVIDPDGRILLTNRYVTDQSGYSADEITGRNIKEFFTESSKRICDCNFPGLKETGYNRAEVEFVCKGGRVLQMECSATAIPDKNNAFTSFLIIQRDITERNQAAKALLDIERRFRAIFNSTFQFIGLLSPDGILLEANQASLDFAGVTNEDVVGKPFWETVWWAASAEEQQRLQEAIGKAAQGNLVRYEARNYDKDNNVVEVDFSLKPVKNERGETILIIPEGRDITERKQAEEEARRHQLESAHLMRLSIMGEMAAGMAHELNQPLAALISYCGTALSIAKELPAVPDGLIKMLKYSAEQTHRSSEIIKHIRSFVSKGSASKMPVDVDLLITEMLGFIDWELRNCNVKFSQDLQGGQRMVMANRVQIEQVLLNLVRNSLEAIQNAAMSDGELCIKSRVLADNTLRLTVSDNGPGIAPDIRKKLFEPFQTTRESGMGMGLSVCRSIIQDHRGKIRLDDLQPQGTSFTIELPLIDESNA